MKHLKKFLLFFVGVCVLIMALVLFFFAQRSSDLESATLKNWRSASLERRVAAVRVLTASENDTDLTVACVDKMSTLPDSGEMAIKDAVSLCYTGIQLKENL